MCVELSEDLDVPEMKELGGKGGLISCSVVEPGYKTWNGMTKQ